MNILFSSDDNYARHLGVAMYSLLCHNTQTENILIRVVDNNISPENKEKLQIIVKEFSNAELFFIPFEQWADNLHLNMSWPISLSSYARLFVGEMLPNAIDRVLYMDCDMVVNGDLQELWNTELGENIIGAVQDQVSENVKVSIGLNPIDPYFNAGMLLINLKKWRDENLGIKCLSFINCHKGQVIHHDQGVLNGLLKDKWFRLPLKCNVMTIHYMMSQNRIRSFYHDISQFYHESEIVNAIQKPLILHYTPSFTTHPWEKNCKHVLKGLYLQVLSLTPWKGFPLIEDRSPWYVRILNWRYRVLPF